MSNKNKLEKRFQEPSSWKWDHFENARGNKLRYGSLEVKKPDAHIIYVEGLSEYAEKTFEIANDFKNENCSFWVLDRQGQGLSGRFLKDYFKQHSEGFEEDTQDLAKLVKEIMPQDNAPVILLGHSTGGLISMLALHNNPDLYDKAILTAPLMGVKNPLVNGREASFAKLPDYKTLLESYTLGGGKWKARDDRKSFTRPTKFSSDPVRNKIQDHWQKANPDLQIGSPTYGWLKSACNSILKIRDQDYLDKIKHPVLIFTAGDDFLVEVKQTFNTAANMKNADVINFEKGKHELLMEEDTIRKPLFQKSMTFIKSTNKLKGNSP
jgi:lysophospholipase